MKLGLIVAASAIFIAGCAEDFVTDPTRPRPTRAVASPTDQASSSSEVMGAPQGSVPLVEVTTGDKAKPAQVRTVVDNAAATITETEPAAAGTIETTTAPAQPVPTLHVDPITGKPTGQ